MNFLRTITRDEKPSYVDKLFVEGQQPADADGTAAPIFSIFWPVPFVPQENLEGGYSYLVHDWCILGYARVARVERVQATVPVGSEGEPVAASANIHIEGAYTRTTTPLRSISVSGFQGIRYTPVALHAVSEEDARSALRTAMGR